MCKLSAIVLSPPQSSLAHLGFFSGADESGRHQRQAPAAGVAAWDRASCSARSCVFTAWRHAPCSTWDQAAATRAAVSGSIAARETAATGSAAFKWQPLRMMVAATNDMCAGKGVVRVIAWHFVILRQVACMSARL